MSNYTHSQDLVTDILFRNGEPTDGTSDFDAIALQYLNRGYQIIWTGGAELDPSLNEKWLWLRKNPPGVLTLEPRIVNGTVNVTKGSTAITFSVAPDPAIQATVSGWFFRVDNSNGDVFRIATNTSGSTSAVLDSRYTGTTATAASYRLFKLEYTLATDVLNVISPMRAYQSGRDEIEGMTIISLDRRWPLRTVDQGVPHAFAHIDEQRVRFDRYGGTATGDLMRVEYDYMRAPADLTDATGSVPLVPRQYRRGLADIATGWLMVDKNDNRADAILLAARQGLKAMARENQQRLVVMGRTFGKIIPRPSELEEHTEALRTESGVILG